MITVCKDCHERHPACHDKCQRYQEQRQQNIEKKKMIIEQKGKIYGTSTDHFEHNQRMKSKYPGKVFKSNKS